MAGFKIAANMEFVRSADKSFEVGDSRVVLGAFSCIFVAIGLERSSV